MHASYNAADQMIQTARLQQLIIQKGAGTRQGKDKTKNGFIFLEKNIILGFDLTQTFLSLTKFIKKIVSIFINTNKHIITTVETVFNFQQHYRRLY
jgi:hypothetical protein